MQWKRIAYFFQQGLFCNLNFLDFALKKVETKGMAVNQQVKKVND